MNESVCVGEKESSCNKNRDLKINDLTHFKLFLPTTVTSKPPEYISLIIFQVKLIIQIDLSSCLLNSQLTPPALVSSEGFGFSSRVLYYLYSWWEQAGAFEHLQKEILWLPLVWVWNSGAYLPLGAFKTFIGLRALTGHIGSWDTEKKFSQHLEAKVQSPDSFFPNTNSPMLSFNTKSINTGFLLKRQFTSLLWSLFVSLVGLRRKKPY